MDSIIVPIVVTIAFTLGHFGVREWRRKREFKRMKRERFSD